MKPQLEEDLIAKSHEEFFAKFKEEKQGKVPAYEKVNRICDALRQELEAVNNDNVYLLPILTTYIKKQPQEIKQVLALIQNMQKKEAELN